MRALILLLSLLFPLQVYDLASVSPQQAAQLDQVVITAPLPGQALQGDIMISGNTALEGFAASEISFGYTGDSTGTWFLIQYSTLPVADGLLTHWDTTTITDGNYTLRLMLYISDGSQITLIVPGLRVRNYTPVETDTPTPLPPSPTSGPGTPLPPSPTPSVTPIPSATPLPATPTPLPTNPAIISQVDVLTTIGEGAGIGIGILALLGAIVGIRQWLRSRK
jgi:hypothetical protein